jgi:hypothetical protein
LHLHIGLRSEVFPLDFWRNFVAISQFPKRDSVELELYLSTGEFHLIFSNRVANFTIRGNLGRIDRYKIFMAIKEACSFIGICAYLFMRNSIQFWHSAIQLALNGLFLKSEVKHSAIGTNYLLLLKSSDDASFYDLAENLKFQIS